MIEFGDGSGILTLSRHHTNRDIVGLGLPMLAADVGLGLFGLSSLISADFSFHASIVKILKHWDT